MLDIAGNRCRKTDSWMYSESGPDVDCLTIPPGKQVTTVFPAQDNPQAIDIVDRFTGKRLQVTPAEPWTVPHD